MKQPNDTNSRKKFLLLGLGALFTATGLRFFTRGKKEIKDTVKMLTEDGRLVEIDKDQLSGIQRKITDKELQAWVKNKPAQP